MTRILLLRHAHSVANAKGILAGQIAGVNLTERGVKESLALFERLRDIEFSHIRVSPMERCQETIAPLIAHLSKSTSKGVAHRFKFEVDQDLIEVDYGRWSGKKLSSLARSKEWKIVQNNPSAMYFPGGEGLLAVQARAMRALNSIALAPGKGTRVLVSHGDIIKSIVASVLGTHLDHFQKIVIDPASVTVLDFNGSDFRVLTLNNTNSPIKSFAEDAKSSKRALIGGGAGRVTRK